MIAHFGSPLLVLLSLFGLLKGVGGATTSSNSVDYSCLHASSWQMNTNNYTNALFKTKPDILTSKYTTSSSYTIQSMASTSNAWQIGFNRIPNYDHTFTTSEITTLNSRTNAATDFAAGGKTTAVEGSYYVFGTNIGYKTTSCSLGWWPPGPVCPTVSVSTTTFPLMPLSETATTANSAYPGCYVGAGQIGVWVTGAKIYGFGDGKGFRGIRTGTYGSSANIDSNLASWHNMAPVFEANDMDVCGGHAANGDYHHHSYPPCMAIKLNDYGSTGHSQIWGWVQDGFPLYGPWQAKNTLSKSCWAKRDYTSISAGGCGSINGVVNGRTCQLNNIHDLSAGTTTITNATFFGPYTTDTLTTQSRNTITAVSGVFLEDYYYNASCGSAGGENLDSYNGHDHDGLGYHYHVTVDKTMTPTFPYLVGPKFKGCVKGGKCNGLPASQSSAAFATPRNGWTGGSTTSISSSTQSQCFSGTTFSYSLSQGKTTAGCTTYTLPTPSAAPSAAPTAVPSAVPSAAPSAISSTAPSTFIARPTALPTAIPTPTTPTPTSVPSPRPSLQPTPTPSTPPTPTPSAAPSAIPSTPPTLMPTTTPTPPPTSRPSVTPTPPPSLIPTTAHPSANPSPVPTHGPTAIPTPDPTAAPKIPTATPTPKPTRPTKMPTVRPSVVPSSHPTVEPTPQPSAHPSVNPTTIPTPIPTKYPTPLPSVQPSPTPTTPPSPSPSAMPSAIPSALPTFPPSPNPTMISDVPTPDPTAMPTAPSAAPSAIPTTSPSAHPTAQPTHQPSPVPTPPPTPSPTFNPTPEPTKKPTAHPTGATPTGSPTRAPASEPSARPLLQPTDTPTLHPTHKATEAGSNPPSSPPVPVPTERPSSSASAPVRAPSAGGYNVILLIGGIDEIVGGQSSSPDPPHVIGRVVVGGQASAFGVSMSMPLRLRWNVREGGSVGEENHQWNEQKEQGLAQRRGRGQQQRHRHLSSSYITALELRQALAIVLGDLPVELFGVPLWSYDAAVGTLVVSVNIAPSTDPMAGIAAVKHDLSLSTTTDELVQKLEQISGTTAVTVGFAGVETATPYPSLAPSPAPSAAGAKSGANAQEEAEAEEAARNITIYGAVGGVVLVVLILFCYLRSYRNVRRMVTDEEKEAPLALQQQDFSGVLRGAPGVPGGAGRQISHYVVHSQSPRLNPGSGSGSGSTVSMALEMVQPPQSNDWNSHRTIMSDRRSFGSLAGLPGQGQLPASGEPGPARGSGGGVGLGIIGLYEANFSDSLVESQVNPLQSPPVPLRLNPISRPSGSGTSVNK